jgi:hypothetical protein
VFWYRNLVDKGEPRFAPGVRLIPTPKAERLMGLAVADWDGNGWPALVVFRSHSPVEVYRRDVPRR